MDANETMTTEVPGDTAEMEVPQASPELQAAFTQAKWHILAFLGAVILFAVAESWLFISGLFVAGVFATLAAILSGFALAQLLHEWGHYAGARMAGADAPLKSEPALLAYDFDFKKNDNRQFLWMSYGGTIGNFLTIFLVWMLIPMDAPHRIALLATAIGMAGFVAYVEWPVINKVRNGEEPMVALAAVFGEGAPLFKRAAGVAVGVGLLAYWII